MNVQYVWLVWSLAFLIPWLIVYIATPAYRSVMMKLGLMLRV